VTQRLRSKRPHWRRSGLRRTGRHRDTERLTVSCTSWTLMRGGTMPNGATQEHCFETASSGITVSCVDAIRHSPTLGMIRQAQWPRSVSLSQGRARATTNSSSQPHRRTAAASVAASSNRCIVYRQSAILRREQDVMPGCLPSTGGYTLELVVYGNLLILYLKQFLPAHSARNFVRVHWALGDSRNGSPSRWHILCIGNRGLKRVTSLLDR